MDRLFSNKKIGKSKQDVNGYACTYCDGVCISACLGTCGYSCAVGCCGYTQQHI